MFPFSLSPPLLTPLPQPHPGRRVALRSERRALPAPFSRIFFPHHPTALTQLARLFIKTSKLTGFNRVRFTLFITSIYYLLRPIPATSFRSLILSHKSRPPKIPPPAPHSRRALSSASLSLHILLFLHAIPFTPSTEYRSTPRNVVLAFARVPFYPSA